MVMGNAGGSEATSLFFLALSCRGDCRSSEHPSFFTVPATYMAS